MENQKKVSDDNFPNNSTQNIENNISLNTEMIDFQNNVTFSNNNSNNSSVKNKLFNIDEILEKCQEKNGIELLNYMCGIMKEKKRNILELLYKELGKEFLIAMLEKTLEIENKGGLMKGKSIYDKKSEGKPNNEKTCVAFVSLNNEKKSTGGIFFTLIKRDPEGKSILNKAMKLDMKESRQRKKVYKLMDKLNI